MEHDISLFGSCPVTTPSVIIVEPNPYHGVILPGFADYFEKLGYGVAILMRNENFADKPFSRYENRSCINIFHGNAAEIKRTLLEEKIAEYDYVLISSSAFWEPGVYQSSYIRYLGFIPKPKYGTLLIEHNLSHLEEDDCDLLLENQRVMTLYPFMYDGKTTVMLNPHYLGDFNSHLKSKMTKFITVGSISQETKNFDLLINAVSMLIDREITNFEVNVVGSGSLDMPQRLQKYIKHLGRLDFPELFKKMDESDYYLPLLDPEIPAHRRYLTGTTTGSSLLILATGLPPVVNEEFGNFYGFNDKKSIPYQKNRLAEAMEKAIRQTPLEHSVLVQAVNSYSDSLKLKSTINLKATLETLKNIDKKVTEHVDQQQLTIAKSRLLRDINKTRLEIKELRRQLMIDDGSVLFKLKSLFLLVKTDNGIGAVADQSDKLAELSMLTRYRNRLTKLKRMLFFVPQVVALVDRLQYILSAAPTAAALDQLHIPQQTVIIFGAIPYTGRYQRPQHLAEELKKRGWRIVYAEMGRSSFPSIKINQIKDKIYNAVMTVTGNPNITMQIPTKRNIEEISSFIKQLHIGGKTVLKIDHPFWSFMVGDTYPAIYDCMDDHESFETGCNEFVALEKMLAVKSAAVFASSRALKTKMETYGTKRVELLPNAGDFGLFSKAAGKELPVPADMQNLRGKIIGYYGAIAEWFDEKIVMGLAERFPNDTIVLIGQVSHPSLMSQTARYNNVRFLGEKPYRLLPNYLQIFDVCLIPFVLNDLIKATNPVKIYEYFAAGKPVVSTDLPELQEYKQIMYLSKSREEFIRNVSIALKEKGKKLILERQNVAQKNTWDQRGAIINNEINLFTW